MADALMKQFTGKQTGGKSYTQRGGDETEAEKNTRLAKEAADAADAEAARLATGAEEEVAEEEVAEVVSGQDKKTFGGRRHRRHSKGHKGNSWLAHVKATMKLHPGKSFKQILKIAKKTYKKSQSRSQSQSGGKRRQNQKSQKSQKKYQNGGSGGKMAGLGESAAPYV
jgi:hypothetical protein